MTGYTKRTTASDIDLIQYHLSSGNDLTLLDDLPRDRTLFIEDHLGGGDGEDGAAQRLVKALQKAPAEPAVAIEYVRHSITQQVNVICWPRQTLFVALTLARYVKPDPWQQKTAAFNFMINKPRYNRTRLVDRLTDLGLRSEHYSLPGSQSAHYVRRCWINSDMRVLSDQILNGSVSNVEIYQSWLKSHVFEPTVISLITEPAWHEQACFLSEKTVWAWESGTMPIWVGSWGVADAMAELGFDVFYDIIDHGYQHEIDPHRRMEMAIANNHDLLSDTKKLINFFQCNTQRFEYNRRHMRSGEWFRRHVNKEIARTGISAQDLACLMFYSLDDANNYESKLLTSRHNSYIIRDQTGDRHG